MIALARHVRTMPIGATVRVLADDPAAATDIPAWCRLRHQDYLGSPYPDAYDVSRRS